MLEIMRVDANKPPVPQVLLDHLLHAERTQGEDVVCADCSLIVPEGAPYRLRTQARRVDVLCAACAPYHALPLLVA